MTKVNSSLFQAVSDTDFVLYVGDVRDVLAQMPDGSVDCCVTSPPYWGLRDYGTGSWTGGDPDCDHSSGRGTNVPQTKNPNVSYAPAGHRGGDPSTCSRCGASRVDQQLGLEATPDAYVANMVAVFREVRRVLTDTGTCWLNLGDSYCSDLKWGGRSGNKNEEKVGYPRPRHRRQSGVKPKDLVGIPWMVAFALRDDGWFLRSDIIWAKRNVMPESVTDRPTKSHEYVFLLAKSERYHFDQDAIREPLADASAARYQYAFGGPKNVDLHRQDAEGLGNRTAPIGMRDPTEGRNARTVWEIATQPYAEAHFATFPLELPRRCIAAGCPAGGTVLDPFMGSGTTALAARGLGRKSIGVELNEEYAQLCARRLAQQSLLAEAM